MTAVADGARRCFDSAVVTRCRPGEAVSGDLGMLVRRPGVVFVAAIDGAGHGPEAAGAARRAAAVVTRFAESDHSDVSALMRKCHVALRDTRGAAISLAHLSCATSTMSWLGIGNVEGRIMAARFGRPRRDESLRLRPGVAGHELPALTAATVEIGHGDLIAFASDGIDRRFADRLDPAGAPAVVARRIMDGHWNGDDDALVVVLRWLANGPGRAA